MPFTSTLKVEHLSQDDDAHFFGEGQWRLLEDVCFASEDGYCYTAPAGLITDFASVPRLPFAYWLTGGTGHRAAVVHDYLCRTQGFYRKKADELFLEMLLSTGVKTPRAKLMWLGVRIGAILGGSLRKL